MSQIRLQDIEVSHNRIDYYFTVDGKLQTYFDEKNHLFLEYNEDVQEVPEGILAIPFVANVIPLVWMTDSTLYVDVLDQEFTRCLHRVKEAYQRMFPHFPFGGLLQVEREEELEYVPEVEAASLFSGGLDALTTFIRIKDKHPILITEYGWHGDDIQYSEVWEADKENARRFAEEYNLRNIFIQSNYGTFVKAQRIDLDFRKDLGDTWWHGLHHSLAIISAAIPVAFKLKINTLYIASSNSYKYPDVCASDPTVDNEIRYASGKVFHDAYELTRQDKVQVIVNHYAGASQQVNIRVCFRREQNCCKCEKCLRTIMGIVVEGGDPRKFGFHITNLSQNLRLYLNEEVKFFSNSFIDKYWVNMQRRMKENAENILDQDLYDWFIRYDFVKQRRNSLFKYRMYNFIPIMKRKVQGLFG